MIWKWGMATIVPVWKMCFWEPYGGRQLLPVHIPRTQEHRVSVDQRLMINSDSVLLQLRYGIAFFGLINQPTEGDMFADHGSG